MFESEQSQTEMRLRLNHEIRKKERELSIARSRRRAGTLCVICAPTFFLAIYIINWIAPPWLNRTAFNIPAVLTCIATAIFALWFTIMKGGPVVSPEKLKLRDQRDKEPTIELDLAMLRERKKVLANRGQVDLNSRRAAYREEAFADADALRRESKHYRRVHSILQGIMIVGSLAATGVSGISIFNESARWVTVLISFSVGIASGFIGYFKYRERSFYLQQTSDAIEEEWEALELGIGRYKRASSEEEALRDFVEEVHRLKNEQRKREQHLDQPAEQRTSPESEAQ